MEQNRIVYEGRSKKGTDISIRYPTIGDLDEMTRYINTLSKEKTYILFQGEQQTKKEELVFLKKCLRNIQTHRGVTLLVFHGETIIAASGIEMKEKALNHTGSFGISVAKEYRREGIGKLLMELVQKEAEKNLEGLRIIELGVCQGNDVALAMYKNYGFNEFGRLPKGIRHGEEFVDHIFMFKSVHE